MRTLRLSLAGTVILALLGGLGVTALAQEEVAPDEDLTGPVQFTWLEDDGVNIVTTDPRFSGKLVERDWEFVEVLPYNVSTSRSRWENEAGAWECAGSEYSHGDMEWYYIQRWCVGEGAYEGLSAITFDHPDADGTHGFIFEGDPPPMKLPSPLLDTADDPPTE